jgi:D-alanyl-D-alanine carboxypeptidase/D-alanyl-D-alanine-endopeptidase (penicillin-binding protein 4)
MHGHRLGDVFREALPLAGADGTLQNRMKGTAAAGNIRAKTGTLQYVNALSGYVTTAAGEPLAFSVMLNNYSSDGLSSARDDIDEIVVMLASFKGHT